MLGSYAVSVVLVSLLQIQASFAIPTPTPSLTARSLTNTSTSLTTTTTTTTISIPDFIPTPFPTCPSPTKPNPCFPALRGKWIPFLCDWSCGIRPRCTRIPPIPTFECTGGGWVFNIETCFWDCPFLDTRRHTTTRTPLFTLPTHFSIRPITTRLVVVHPTRRPTLRPTLRTRISLPIEITRPTDFPIPDFHLDFDPDFDISAPIEISAPADVGKRSTPLTCDLPTLPDDCLAPSEWLCDTVSNTWKCTPTIPEIADICLISTPAIDSCPSPGRLECGPQGWKCVDPCSVPGAHCEETKIPEVDDICLVSTPAIDSCPFPAILECGPQGWKCVDPCSLPGQTCGPELGTGSCETTPPPILGCSFPGQWRCDSGTGKWGCTDFCDTGEVTCRDPIIDTHSEWDELLPEEKKDLWVEGPKDGEGGAGNGSGGGRPFDRGPI